MIGGLLLFGGFAGCTVEGKFAEGSETWERIFWISAGAIAIGWLIVQLGDVLDRAAKRKRETRGPRAVEVGDRETGSTARRRGDALILFPNPRGSGDASTPSKRSRISPSRMTKATATLTTMATRTEAVVVARLLGRKP